MTLIIELTPEQEAALRARATESGQEVSAFARDTLLREIEQPSSLAEFLAPVREQVAASGITEDELDQLIEEARNEVYEEQKRSGS